MGVRGLTTFMNQKQTFFESYQLHSTKLVIDGYGLMSQFYFHHSIDPGNHGGEFQKFYSLCAHFFQNLSLCGVQPYVVFDGGYDLDRKKFETMKQRCQQKISSVRDIANGGHPKIMPPMASEVFKKALRDSNVAFVFSDFEADRDIAVLANEFRCPVLGLDSDFFIMNIHGGYIPLDRLEWRHPSSKPQKQKKGGSSASPAPLKQRFLNSQRYNLRKFCGLFQVEPDLLPLFASLSGNDYLQSISLNGFYGATKNRNQGKPDGRSHPKIKWHSQFCELLHHLTFYRTLPDCLDEVIKHVSPHERATVKQALIASCAMYEVVTESPIVYHFRQATDKELSASLLVREYGIPAAFLRLLHRGEVPTMCLNMYLNRMYFMGTQVEKLSEVRSSACGDTLLRILAGIMLIDAADEMKSNGETLTIDIYDRDKMHVKCFKVAPMREVPDHGVVTSFKDMPRTPQHQRRSLLLASLNAKGINVDQMPEPFRLVLLVTVYWFKSAAPPVSQKLVFALALGWVQGVAWCQNNRRLIPPGDPPRSGDFGAYFHWHTGEVMAVLDNYDALTRGSKQKYLDLNASHGFAQWMACLRCADYLNAVLLQVFPKADMTVLFNGALLHNLFSRLKEIHPSCYQDWIEGDLLTNAPSASNLFQNFVAFLSHHIELPIVDHQRPPSLQQQARGRHRGGGRAGNPRGRGRRGNHGQREFRRNAQIM